MPIPFDALVYAAHPEFMKLPEEVIKNRELLKTVMQKHGLLKCSFFPTVKNSN
jgi:D-alanyl-D-alanine dipeptidase